MEENQKGQKMKFSRLRIIKNLTIISTSFVLLFMAYNGLSMLQSTMNKIQGVGTVSQAVVYISFGISSLLLPNFVIKTLGTKTTLLLAIILYLPYLASNFYPMWITLIPSAVLTGIGASILWGSQCTYFNESSVIFCTLDEDGVVEILNHVGETSSTKTSSNSLSVCSYEHQSTEELSSSNNSSKCGIVNCQLSIRNIKRKSLEELNRKDLNNGSKSEVHPDSLKQQYTTGYIISKNLSDGIQNNSSDSLKKQCHVTEKSDVTQNHRQHNALGQLNNGQIQQKKRQLSNIDEDDISIIYKPKSLGIAKQTLPEDFTSNGVARPLQSNGVARNVTEETEIFETYAAIDSANACFFGCHGLAYYSAQVWSNLMTYYVLYNHKPHNFTRVYGCSCGADFCYPEPECVKGDSDHISLETRYLLTGLSVGLGVIAALLIMFFLDPLNKEKESVTFSWKQVLATFHHAKKKEQILLVPLSLYVGMAQGFYTADITKSYIACAWGPSHVGLVTVFYGLACALSSTVSGCLVQFMGRIPIFLIGQIGNIINYTFLLMWSPEVHHPLMFYLAATMWGIITGLFWSQLQAFYGVLFQGDEEAAFGSYYLYSSMGWTISFLYSNYICTSIKIYILCGVSSIGIIGYLITERKHHIRKKQMNEPD